MRMYHPNLEPPHNECEALDDAQAAVYAESGWLPAPEPVADSPAHVPTVRYRPDDRTDAERDADDKASSTRGKRTKTEPVKGKGTTD